MIYVGSMTTPTVMALEAPDPPRDIAYITARGQDVTIDGIPIVNPPWGRITALDLKTGTIAWQIANADTPEKYRNHPLLQGVDLPRTGIQTRAGLLVTKSLLFAGEGWGGSPVLRAHDKLSGEI
ncbi:MAG: PQQ-binding-like beta-propeller repeat protein, partial [Pseudomonadales bacterium]|nr:PQQ-binding-like beta-propeller repeat protein [Pseudomonadales bacterium]